MDRRSFLGFGGSLLGLSSLARFRFGAFPDIGTSGQPPSVDSPPRPPHLLHLPATLQANAFASATGDDARYHALVYEGGGAADKSLLTTPRSDTGVARELRAAGARDGGGVPMSAWTLRRLPLVRAPDRRVEGSPLAIYVEWDGWSAPRELSSLLRDPGGRGSEFRFGGNEEHNDRWESGCIVCLFSCPGGVISNARYSIRDHVRGATRFSPAPDLPPDGTEVTVTLELLRGSQG